jgi:16S rRNA processing protein RimM
MDFAWVSMVAVGRVARPHGNRGWVVVNPETDFGEERFATGATVYCDRGGQVAAMIVEDSRAYDRRWVVHFEGLSSIDDAERLRDVELRIPVETVRPLGPGGYYEYDLVGCEVLTTAGCSLGRVDRVESGTGVPVLVLEGGDGAVLIPLAAEICREVDVPAKRITVDLPEGLVDLNRPSVKRRVR